MSNKALTLAGLVLALGVTAVAAQNVSVVQQRREVLKGMGAAAKAPGAMLQGKEPFALAPVQMALRTFTDAAPKLQGLFPDDSKTGGDTAALPLIWATPADTADVKSRFKKLGDDAQAAMVAIKDEATFKAEMGKVFANCGGCHKLYRQAPKG